MRPSRSSRSGVAANSRRVYGCLGSWYSASTGPCSATRPAYITTLRSHSCATTGRSCVTRSSASPSSRQSASSSSRICACTITSSAVVGSSAISTFGLHESAIAIAARWRIPPDSSCGNRPARAAGIPTDSSSSPTRRLAAEPRASPCSSSASTIWLPTVRTGFSAFIAPWNTIAMSTQRCGRIEDSPPASTSTPSSSTRPAALALGGRSPMIASAVVVLPQPDSPTSPSRSPRSSVKPTPCTAWSSPPSWRSNHTCRSSTCSSGAFTVRRPGRRAVAAGTCAPTGARREAVDSAHPRASRRRGCSRE